MSALGVTIYFQQFFLNTAKYLYITAHSKWHNQLTHQIINLKNFNLTCDMSTVCLHPQSDISSILHSTETLNFNLLTPIAEVGFRR